MRRRKNDDTSELARKAYEQSYGDAEPGGWAPRGRYEDIAERSRYSSQRDHQEDRSGFTRGFQRGHETSERHEWGARHRHGDENDPPANRGLTPPSAAASARWVGEKSRGTKSPAKKARTAKASKKARHAKRPAKLARAAKKSAKKPKASRRRSR